MILKFCDKNEIELNKNRKHSGITTYFHLLLVDFWGFAQLNMIYIISCIPIISIGSATIAFHKLCCKLIRGEHVFIYSDYWDEFKKNFKIGIFLGLMIIIVIFDLLIITTNLISYNYNNLSFSFTIYCTLSILFIFLLTNFTIYLVTLFANIELGILLSIKNAFILSIVGGYNSLFITIFNLFIFIISLMFFPYSFIIFFFLGFYFLFFTNCFFAWPIIDKYVVINDKI